MVVGPSIDNIDRSSAASRFLIRGTYRDKVPETTQKQVIKLNLLFVRHL